MPPKKANTKAKPTPAKRAAAVETPATVTTAKGKEIETTAAAGRPRRATTTADTSPIKQAPAKKAATTKAPAKKANTPSAAPKKRGRPSRVTAEEEEEDDDDDDDEDVAEPPKKRGRPAKAIAEEDENEDVAEPPKKRGRPSKAVEPSKKRGRPTKDAPAIPLDETAPPKKRGRPPKGGQTTKIAADDEAAAEQLGDELGDAAEDEEVEAPSKRNFHTKKPSKATTAKRRGKQAVTADEDIDAEAQGGSDGKQYWLMKAEQEDREQTLNDGKIHNARFTIDDLREIGGPEPWDGVRNGVACKNMRGMKLGDLAFFYASGGKQGRVPGITGIMEIVKEHEPDLSAFDKNHPYYVENDKMRGTEEKPRWSIVHVEFRQKLSVPVPLKELQKYKGGVLENMEELTKARLSVSKVSEDEWNFIVDKLIEGYEDEDALPSKAAKADNTTKPKSSATPNGTDIKQTVESDLPTTDSMLPAETAATSSRPASRAASRAGSRASSRKPISRAASLAPPPRATSRGRSRTPMPRAASAQPMSVVAEEQVERMEVVDE